MSVGYATCDRCGQTFATTAGPGRPRKRCYTCAPAYGAAHQKLRAETKNAVRCGKTMLTGQAIDLHHRDDRSGYLGWSHRSCNRRIGAINGNKARAAAYRAAKNGLNASRLRTPDPPEPDHCTHCGRASCRASYRQNSRCW
jgi:hypothetical protein